VAIAGTLLAPPPLSSKRLEVVGDSISAGFGVGCATNGEAFTYATENNYLTYQAIAARRLGAEVFTMAWSGIGMYRDVGGSTTSASTPQMPVRYLRTIPSSDASTWAFAKYTPGAVVILLGTNDFAQGDPGQPFLTAYVDFAAGVRMRYPAARMYFSVSPMLSTERRTALKNYLGQVVAARNGSGDSNVAIIEFPPVAPNAWACGHPNAATHVIMANLLEQTLKTDLGW
jgi:lysophospholipase L1-like esterase